MTSGRNYSILKPYKTKYDEGTNGFSTAGLKKNIFKSRIIFGLSAQVLKGST
jgi:hypothetical protein